MLVCINENQKPITAVSLLLNLETAQQGRSMLFSDEQRLLSKGRKKGVCIEHQIGFYEHLKLILVRLKCMCVLPGPPKRCTCNVTCQFVLYEPLT
jgi:hypothetical protein